jgi:lipopolysaccharide transport protein LptA
MKKILLIILSVFLCQCAYSFTGNSDPTTITSKALKVNYATNIAEYIDNVFVKQNDFNLSCNKMIIYYKGNADNMFLAGHSNDSQETSIKKIDFFENVIISKDGKIAKGDTGEFSPKVNLITLAGNVSLKERSNYMEGEQATYNTKTGVFKVIGGKSKNNRVQILISDTNNNKKLQNKSNGNKN